MRVTRTGTIINSVTARSGNVIIAICGDTDRIIEYEVSAAVLIIILRFVKNKWIHRYEITNLNDWSSVENWTLPVRDKNSDFVLSMCIRVVCFFVHSTNQVVTYHERQMSAVPKSSGRETVNSGPTTAMAPTGSSCTRHNDCSFETVSDNPGTSSPLSPPIAASIYEPTNYLRYKLSSLQAVRTLVIKSSRRVFSHSIQSQPFSDCYIIITVVLFVVTNSPPFIKHRV